MSTSMFTRQISILSKLGEGSFADVFRVRFDGDPTEYACKRLKDRLHSWDEALKLPEIQTLQAIKGHPNIVELLDVNFESSTGYVILVFELLQVNLYELISQATKPVTEKVALTYIYQILKALAYMHSRGIFHRDIKPENCMVNPGTFEVKLVDFGSAAVVTRSPPFTEYVATRWYRAPECLLTSGAYGPEMDVWAVGCILYELVAGKPLFPGRDEFDQIQLIHRIIGTPDNRVINRFLEHPNDQADYDFIPRKGKQFKTLLPDASDNFVLLIQALLIYDSEKRMKAEEALDHPAFAALRRADILWSETDMKIPLPVFAGSAVSGIPQISASRSQLPQLPQILAPKLTIKVQHGLPNTRIQAAQRIKLYKKAEKPKMFFSVRDRKLLPVLEVKHHIYA
jgi:renal tumor antigen